MVRQEYKCPVCGNLLAKRTNIDHAHVKGWAKMPSEERKLYVRGILDFFCNKYYMGKAITIQKSKNVTKYLQEFENRKPHAD